MGRKMKMKNFLSNTNCVNPIQPSHSSPFFSNQACQDQWICYIEFDKTKNRWQIQQNYNHICSRRNSQSYQCDIDYGTQLQKMNNIVFILESPHIFEYDFTTHMPYGPAQGATGCNIFYYLEEVINQSPHLKLDQELVYRIVLINAIQFQTSEGIKPLDKSIRDNNFNVLWGKDFIVKDFIQRVQYFGKSAIVCNLCTNGKCKPTLHNLVNTVLSKNGIKFFNGYHPSCWYVRKFRTIT